MRWSDIQRGRFLHKDSFSPRASWAGSVMKVTFNTGGRSFPGCFAKRCTRCTCMGSMPSVKARWRTKVVSTRFRSMRVFDSSKGAPSTMTERLWSSALLFSVCRLSMCRHTSFAIPDGEGEGCVVCSGSRFDCYICLTTALPRCIDSLHIEHVMVGWSGDVRLHCIQLTVCAAPASSLVDFVVAQR